MTRVAIRRALISVYDKTGLADLARALHKCRRGDRQYRQHGRGDRRGRRAGHRGGGRHRLPRVPGRPGQDAAPGGARRAAGRPAAARARGPAGRAGHRAVRAAGVQPVPVRGRRSPAAPPAEECVEQIDIGGPAMVRAAAKNHAASRSSPTRRCTRRGRGGGGGRVHPGAAAAAGRPAYAHTARYDAAVASWFASATRPTTTAAETGWPDVTARCGPAREVLRYGENPHQRAALYIAAGGRPGLARPSNCTARRCPSTTTWTPRPPGGPRSISPSRAWPSSSTPTRAVRSCPRHSESDTLDGAGTRSRDDCRRRWRDPIQAVAWRAVRIRRPRWEEQCVCDDRLFDGSAVGLFSAAKSHSRRFGLGDAKPVQRKAQQLRPSQQLFFEQALHRRDRIVTTRPGCREKTHGGSVE